MKEIFKSWMDVEMIIENCPIINNYSYGVYLQIPGSNYGVHERQGALSRRAW